MNYFFYRRLLAALIFTGLLLVFSATAHVGLAEDGKTGTVEAKTDKTAPPGTDSKKQDKDVPDDDFFRELLKRINKFRRENGKSALKYYILLEDVAQRLADEHAIDQNSAFIKGAGDNSTEKRLKNAKISHTSSGEAGCVSKLTDVPTALKELTSNFSEVLLADDFTHMGIGYAEWG